MISQYVVMLVYINNYKAMIFALKIKNEKRNYCYCCYIIIIIGYHHYYQRWYVMRFFDAVMLMIMMRKRSAGTKTDRALGFHFSHVYDDNQGLLFLLRNHFFFKDFFLGRYIHVHVQILVQSIFVLLRFWNKQYVRYTYCRASRFSRDNQLPGISAKWPIEKVLWACSMKQCVSVCAKNNHAWYRMMMDDEADDDGDRLMKKNKIIKTAVDQ